MTVRVCSAGYILHEKERSYYGSGTGWLSVKSFSGGRAYYEVGQSRYAVDDQRYLLLNDGQQYHIEIEAHQPVESFCVFFTPGFAESIRQCLTLSDDRLLDTPASDSPLSFSRKRIRTTTPCRPTWNGCG